MNKPKLLRILEDPVYLEDKDTKNVTVYGSIAGLGQMIKGECAVFYVEVSGSIVEESGLAEPLVVTFSDKGVACVRIEGEGPYEKIEIYRDVKISGQHVADQKIELGGKKFDCPCIWANEIVF